MTTMSDDEVVKERKEEIRREMGRAAHNRATGDSDSDSSLHVA